MKKARSKKRLDGTIFDRLRALRERLPQVRQAEKPRLVRDSTTGPANDAASNVAMELARLRGSVAQPAIEARSGPAISAMVAAQRLHRSSKTIRNQVQKGALVGYRPAADKTEIVLPLWQFAGKDTIHPWVPDLIEAYGANGIALANFVSAPRSNLDGSNYLHLLLDGRADDVIEIARRSNSD